MAFGDRNSSSNRPKDPVALRSGVHSPRSGVPSPRPGVPSLGDFPFRCECLVQKRASGWGEEITRVLTIPPSGS